MCRHSGAGRAHSVFQRQLQSATAFAYLASTQLNYALDTHRMMWNFRFLPNVYIGAYVPGLAEKSPGCQPIPHQSRLSAIVPVSTFQDASCK
jgi:hypothetical protein